MSFFSAKGTLVTASSGTVAISVTGLTFQPKVVIFFLEGSATAGTSTNRGQGGMGFADGTHQGCVGNTFGGVTARGGSVLRTDSCFCKIGTSLTDIGKMGFTSFNADGFTVTPVTAFNAANLVHYVALGGTDVTGVFVGTKALPGTGGGGAIAHTGFGFAPDVLLMLATSEANVVGTIDSGSSMSFGWSTATIQACVGVRTVDNTTPTDTRGIIKTTRAIAIPVGNANTTEAEVQVTSLDSDGWSGTQTSSAGTNRTPTILVLGIKGCQVFAGTTANKATTGNTVVTGVGFTPVALLTFMRGGATATQANPTDGLDISIGSTDFTNQGSVWWGAGDNLTGSDVGRVTSTTKMMVRYAVGTPTLVDDQAFVSADAGAGFTFNTTTTGGTASLMPFLAFGAIVAAVTISKIVGIGGIVGPSFLVRGSGLVR